MVVHVIDMSLAGDGNPLNPLGIARRQFIRKELDRAQNDSNITSVVIAGGGKNFSAGADLTEFGNMNAASVTGGDDPESVVPLTYLVSIIENFSKPVVAAMTGNALGGGLEVALSCHYRVADPSGNFGLPEVHVGVIPGAGGTQRLPRLVGVSKALDMILTGKPVSASQALKLGLIDHICSTKEGSVLDAAQKWAAWAELMPLADRRVGQLTIKEPPKQLQQIFQFAKFQLPAPSKGGKGMHAALRAIEACTQPIEEGMKVEADMFTKTLIGQQGRGLRHGFFAVRKAQKPLVKLAPSQHVLLEKSFSSKSAGVIGAGLMGSGIALVLLQAGFTVYLVDVSKTSLDKGMAFLQGTIHSYVKRKRMTAEKGKQLLASLKPTQRMEDLSSCCLVVEAVIENLTIKQKIFASLDEIVTSPDAILLSNTSTLDIDAMASALKPSRRSNFAGWHFFSPAHIMKLVEIVVGKETSLETVGVLQQLTKRIKKIGVVVGNCDGFVGNRMLIPYSAETCFLLEEGVATVSSVDNAFLKFGIALGPFQMADLAGLDVGYNIKIARGLVNKDGSPGPNRPERYSDISDIMVKDLNRLGQKSQKVRLSSMFIF